MLVEADSAKVVTDRRLFGVGLGRAGEWPLWFGMMDICMAGADEDDMQIVREGGAGDDGAGVGENGAGGGQGLARRRQIIPSWN